MSGRYIFAVADLHGRTESLGELLRAGGVLNSDGSRNYQVESVQLGDLANVVMSDEVGDCLALDLAMYGRPLNELEQTTDLLAGWFDTVLVGNHEHPLFGGQHFSGYYAHPSVAHRVTAMDDRGLWQPSYLVEEMDLLLVHAGWAAGLCLFSNGERFVPSSAIEAHNFLIREWDDNPTNTVFSQVGSLRGGRGSGGVLWSDWEERKTQDFSQIVGHTTDDVVRSDDYSNGNWSLCIDTNAKRYGVVTGALIDTTSGTVEVISRPVREER